MIHLIFGAAATAGLTHALRKQDHQIIGFPIDLSIGPITNINEESGVNTYFSWIKTSFHPVWNYLEGDQRTFNQALNQIAAIKDGEEITIWTSENASEQIGLRISCYLLKEKSVTLNYVNTYHAMQQQFNGKIDIRHTGDCNAEQLFSFYNHSTYPISAEMKNNFAKEGEALLGSKSIVRSWRNGEVVEESETRDDKFILECVERLHQQSSGRGMVPAVKVIGEVISHSEQPLSDMWIEYRIRTLIQSEKLDYEGNLKEMRNYKIKVME
jgi:hypothetical protein